MRAKDAKRLHNRDEVLVRASDGSWEHGYVLGEPELVNGRVIIPVQTPSDGWKQVDHTDVR
jgi:hypothetical protein